MGAAFLSFDWVDQIYCHGFQSEDYNIIRNAILLSWSEGIESEMVEQENSIRFKLKGSPWLLKHLDEFPSSSRILFLSLISMIYCKGKYEITAPISIFSHAGKETLYFRRRSNYSSEDLGTLIKFFSIDFTSSFSDRFHYVSFKDKCRELPCRNI